MRSEEHCGVADSQKLSFKLLHQILSLLSLLSDRLRQSRVDFQQ